ncbi:MAG: CcmD family protein [Polyangiaceae bacterium]|nr:CcmD family protein [Polyangiaceae bacterium]
MSDPMTAAATPDDRATTFQAVQGPQAEHYSGEVLLVTAYALVWALIMIWVAIIWRKQSAMTARVAELEKILDRAAAAPDAK